MIVAATPRGYDHAMRSLPLSSLAFLLLCGCPSDGGSINDADADNDGHERPADCNDDDALVYPGAPELCDGKDNDCDGVIDAGDVVGGATFYRDVDGDGHAPPGADWIEACDRVDGYSRLDDDCDDDDPDNYPGNDEQCDGQDNDCDDETEAKGGEDDRDEDGHPDCDDCDDDDPDRFPGNEEICDGLDNDCDDELGADEMVDMDIDGFPSCADCDDDNFLIYPGAEEQCDGIDTDCDETTNVGGPDGELDRDDDTFLACAECDDDDPDVRPGITEECDGVDTDCDGAANFGGEPEVDLDGDLAWACEDCDESDPTIYDGAPELCDGLDNDCDGATNFDVAGEIDGDNDGFPSCNDCADGDSTSYPGAPEVCDGADNDCDGTIDIGNIAADLDGTGDRIVLPAIVPGMEVTVEAWVWFDDLVQVAVPPPRTVVHKVGSSGDDLLIGSSGAVEWDAELWLNGPSILAINTGPQEMFWYHVAMTYDGSVQRFYVDGVEVDSLTVGTGLAMSNTGAWTLGARDDGGVFVDDLDGMIDEVRIWDVARTATEIDEARCTPLDGTEPGLIAYLPLDGDFGDLTGNGNDGTAVGDTMLLPF
jgi:hypothetical protein